MDELYLSKKPEWISEYEWPKLENNTMVFNDQIEMKPNHKGLSSDFPHVMECSSY